MARMRVFMVFVLAMTAGGALAFGTYNYVQHLPAKTVSIAPQFLECTISGFTRRIISASGAICVVPRPRF